MAHEIDVIPNVHVLIGDQNDPQVNREWVREILIVVFSKKGFT